MFQSFMLISKFYSARESPSVENPFVSHKIEAILAERSYESFTLRAMLRPRIS